MYLRPISVQPSAASTEAVMWCRCSRDIVISEISCQRDHGALSECVSSVFGPNLTSSIESRYSSCRRSAVTIGNVAQFTAWWHWKWTFLVAYLEETTPLENDANILNLCYWTISRVTSESPYFTFVIPRAWSCTQPTIRVLCAGPQTGQGPQAADLQRGGHGVPPQRRLRVGGGAPLQWNGETSLSPLSVTSAHLNFPIWRPPPQLREHCENSNIFQINFLVPITLLSTWDWLSRLLKSGFDNEISGFVSRSLVRASLWCLWWRWATWCGGAGFDVGISLLVSSGSRSVKNSYFMFGFGCVYRIWK